MMDSSTYALQLERKLIDDFKEHFFEKIGYYPTVMTQFQIDGNVTVPVMNLNLLKSYFDQFIPEKVAGKYRLESRCRMRELVELRNMYCFMARIMGYSLNTIGEHIGMRHHTTIMHSLTAFKNLLETDDSFRRKYSNIFSQIKQQYESSVMANFDQVQRKPEPALLSGLLQIQDQAHQHHQC